GAANDGHVDLGFTARLEDDFLCAYFDLENVGRIGDCNSLGRHVEDRAAAAGRIDFLLGVHLTDNRRLFAVGHLGLSRADDVHQGGLLLGGGIGGDDDDALGHTRRNRQRAGGHAGGQVFHFDFYRTSETVRARDLNIPGGGGTWADHRLVGIDLEREVG